MVTPAAPRSLGDIDCGRAMQHVRALDLREEWIPDVLRHEDQLADAAHILSNAERRVKHHDFGASIGVEIPKTPFFSRSGQLLSLEDRIALHSVVALFADTVEEELEKVVYSARLATRGRYFTRKGITQWNKWLSYVSGQLRRSPWMIKTDITAYFVPSGTNRCSQTRNRWGFRRRSLTVWERCCAGGPPSSATGCCKDLTPAGAG